MPVWLCAESRLRFFVTVPARAVPSAALWRAPQERGERPSHPPCPLDVPVVREVHTIRGPQLRVLCIGHQCCGVEEEVGPAARSYAVVQLRQPFTIAHARPEWDAERRRLRAGLPSRRMQCGDVRNDRDGLR